VDEDALNRLMDRLVDGDRDAFTPWFEARHPRALAVARRRLGDGADAEDAAQRTMTALFGRSIEFTRGRPVLPWFYAIAANETHAVARKKHVQSAREGHLSDPALHAIAMTDDDPETALSLAEMRELLRDAILALDPLSAAAIERQLALAAEGKKTPLSPTLRKRLSRAYARLRTLLVGVYESP
jgi:RNA polymerase sigma factor (sigma-70 family)